MAHDDNPFAGGAPWVLDSVHWHAYFEERERGAAEPVLSGPAYRVNRLATTPDAVLLSPWDVARWIDGKIVLFGDMVEVKAGRDGWVRIGDDAERAHLRHSNAAIAMRGDSLYTDVYSETRDYYLYVEAVTADDCTDPRHGGDGPPT